MLPEKTDRYCEAHVTVQPHAGTDFASFARMVRGWNWKASTFEVDEVDDIAGMWFLSARDDCPKQLARDVLLVNRALSSRGYVVLRSKLEQTLFDTKLGDELSLLTPSDPPPALETI